MAVERDSNSVSNRRGDARDDIGDGPNSHFLSFGVVCEIHHSLPSEFNSPAAEFI
jgi:hypothetical protein